MKVEYMNLEQEISRLLEMAAPLRELEDDDPAKEPLAGIVDEINKLRAAQDQDGRGVLGNNLWHRGPIEPGVTQTCAEVSMTVDGFIAVMPRPQAELHAIGDPRIAAAIERADKAQKPRRKPGPKPKNQGDKA